MSCFGGLVSSFLVLNGQPNYLLAGRSHVELAKAVNMLDDVEMELLFGVAFIVHCGSHSSIQTAIRSYGFIWEMTPHLTKFHSHLAPMRRCVAP